MSGSHPIHGITPRAPTEVARDLENVCGVPQRSTAWSLRRPRLSPARQSPPRRPEGRTDLVADLWQIAMLQCSMATNADLQSTLEDLLAQLWHARRTGDLGRLAHLSFSEVQRWGRGARDDLLVRHAQEFLARCPYGSRDDLTWAIDALIADVEFAHSRLAVDLVTH
jgi:hypothetical protein